jgi:3-hydroxyisobutyrate dehydrogenase-like beta-hydroxyacid dehydrogenase
VTSTAAVIGVGNLGSGIASRLAQVGPAPLVHDRDPAAVESAVAAGCRSADLTEIAARADVIWLVTSGEEALDQLLDASTGLLAAPKAESLILLSSTIDPQAAIDAARRCATAGRRLVEAPISGGAEAAAAGELLVLLGGDPADVADARAACDLIARRVIITGPVGTASTVKLANQHVLFATLAAVYEAVSLGHAAGVDEDTIVDALTSGTARSWVVEMWGFYDRLSRDYNERSVDPAQRPWVKDLAHVRDTADRLGVEMHGPAGDQLDELITRHAGAAATTARS